MKAPFSLGTPVSLTLSSPCLFLGGGECKTRRHYWYTAYWFHSLRLTTTPHLRQTPGRMSRGVKKHLSGPAPIGVLFHKVRSCPRPHFFFLAAANTKLAASSASNLEPLRLQTLQRVVYDSIRLHMTHDDCRRLQSGFILYD